MSGKPERSENQNDRKAGMTGKLERMETRNAEQPGKPEIPESLLRHYNNETKHPALTDDADRFRNVNYEQSRVRSFSRKGRAFLEKEGLFWKKPYFFSDCQVLVV